MSHDATACEVELRLDEPMPGVALLGCHPFADGARISLNVYLYGPEAAATAGELAPAWQSWLERHFP